MGRTTKLRLKLMERQEPEYLLGALAGMPQSRISEYALGKRRMPTHHLEGLCRVLRCEPEEILGFDDEDLVVIDET